MIELDKIYNEDCLDGMKRIPDNGVDHCITSPPYNFNLRIHYGEYGGWGSTDPNKYDNMLNDRLPIDEYYEWQKSCIEEMLRISRNLVFYNIQMITGNKVALCKLLGHFAENIKEIIIWDKINAEPAIQERVMNSMFEFIIIFAKENAIARQFDVLNADKGAFANVIRLNKNYKNKGTNHKAIFPLQLPQTLIKTFAKEGDVICDPFMGSGTTAMAAIKEHCHFIGFELEKSYYDIASKRIQAEQQQLKLF